MDMWGIHVCGRDLHVCQPKKMFVNISCSFDDY